MRFTVTVPDSLDEVIREHCEAIGLSKSEFINRAVAERIERSAPGYAPPLSPDLEALEAERDRLKAEASAAADQARTAAAEAARAREDLAARDQLLAERADAILTLRADLERERDGRRHDLIETAAGYVRTALTATAGPSAGTVEAAAPVRRSWWDRLMGRTP